MKKIDRKTITIILSIVSIIIFLSIITLIFSNVKPKTKEEPTTKENITPMDVLDNTKWEEYFKADIETEIIKDKMYYKVYFTQIKDDIILENLYINYDLRLRAKVIYKNGYSKEQIININIEDLEKIEDKKYVSKGEYMSNRYDIKEIVKDEKLKEIYVKRIRADISYK